MNPIIPENSFLKQSKLRQIFESAPKDAINLAIGQPGEDTPPFIKEAAIQVLSDHTKTLGYTANAGIIPLREKIAASYNSTDISATNICITAGVQEALYALFYVLVKSDTDILLPNPGFLTYPALAGLMGNTPRYYECKKEDNYRFNADEVIKEIKSNTQIILLAHPSNPTGSNAEKAEIKKLISFCQNRKEGPIWIIADEVYHGMSYTDCAYISDYMDEYPYIISLRGASKSHHMTGWRIGWAAVPNSLITKYIAAHQYICTCANALTQWTLSNIWGTKEEIEWKQFQQQLYKEKRDIVEEKLKNHYTMYGGEGAFYWMIEPKTELKTAAEEDAWVQNLLHKSKVITVPGSAFGSACAGQIRLSYGPNKIQLIEGLDRLIEAAN